MKNNKGFVATGMIFIILLLFLALYSSLLALFSNRRKIYETIKDDILNDSDIISRSYYLSTANIGQYVSYPVTYTNQACGSVAANTLNSWQILNVIDDTVTLVSSGIPVCYNPSNLASGETTTQAIDKLLGKYLNQTYAQKVRTFNVSDFHDLTAMDHALCLGVSSQECGNDNGLIDVGNYYLSSEDETLYQWTTADKKLAKSSNQEYGLRVVVELKSLIASKRGTGTQDDPYILSKPQ